MSSLFKTGDVSCLVGSIDPVNENQTPGCFIIVVVSCSAFLVFKISDGTCNKLSLFLSFLLSLFIHFLPSFFLSFSFSYNSSTHSSHHLLLASTKKQHFQSDSHLFISCFSLFSLFILYSLSCLFLSLFSCSCHSLFLTNICCLYNICNSYLLRDSSPSVLLRIIGIWNYYFGSKHSKLTSNTTDETNEIL